MARTYSSSQLYCASGGPKLKCADLLTHVAEVLQSSFSCAAFGEDYSSILLKNILSVRKYWCEITPQQWHCEFSFLYLHLHTWRPEATASARSHVADVAHTLQSHLGLSNYLTCFRKINVLLTVVRVGV